MQLLIWSYWGHRFAAVTTCVLPGLRTSIVRGNCVHETSVKRWNKIVHEIMRNVANVFSFYAVIAIKHGFQCINSDPARILGQRGAGQGIFARAGKKIGHFFFSFFFLFFFFFFSLKWLIICTIMVYSVLCNSASCNIDLLLYFWSKKQ